MKTKVLAAATGFALIVSAGVSAKNDNSVIKEQFGGTQLSFAFNGSSTNSTLTVSGPDGFNMSRSSNAGVPSLDLNRSGSLKDGLYNYEITTNTGPLVLIQDKINNGRGENNSHYVRKGVTKSGHFWVANGQIKKFDNIKEPKFK
jgi:hypothetical protein